ncbi:hypothetical protein NPIL_458301 [Nephila pilipes]|uniref:Uncharacterized protein n=1 Tax=Nephila pilipes TaxID=299642 RepID=A0A8X6R3G8_NEPPI|nr:hypothetical protein NPIL_458301 [Nephila pilipes]
MGDHTVVISAHYDNLLSDPTKLAACPAKRTHRPIRGDGPKSNLGSPRYLILIQPLPLARSEISLSVSLDTAMETLSGQWNQLQLNVFDSNRTVLERCSLDSRRNKLHFELVNSMLISFITSSIICS